MRITLSHSKRVIGIAIVGLLLASCSRTEKPQVETPAEPLAMAQEAPPVVETPPVVEPAAAPAPKSAAKSAAKPADPEAEAAAAAARAEAAEKAAADKAAAEKLAAEKAAAAKAEAEKSAAERAAAEAARLAADKEAAAKAAEEARIKALSQAEKDRLAALEVPEPVVAVNGGLFAKATSVPLEVALKEAVIYYTLDGSEPSATNGRRYTGPIQITASSVLKARAVVPGGKSSRSVVAAFTIGEVCVAPGGSGDGRREAPFGNLASAIAKARSLGIGTVKLAAGSIDGPLEMTDFSLVVVGGWKEDFSAPAAARTVVVARAAGKTSKVAPSYAFKASGSGVNGTARIERVEFRGAEGSYSSGIFVTNGAQPEFVDCASYAGFASYGYGAVVSAGAAPKFRSSRLDGGEAASSFGLSVEKGGAIVEGSMLLAGSGTVGGYGLSGTEANVTVTSSVIAGNAANVSYGVAFYNSKESTLSNCTIVGGTGKDVSGVFLSVSAPTIEYCVISASGTSKSYGVNANYGEAAPSKLVGNVFLGSSGGLYWDAGKRLAYSSLDASGAIVGSDGSPAMRNACASNKKGAFALGPAPRYDIPAGAAGEAGARLTSR